jgi:deoxycytidylate deaminase
MDYKKALFLYCFNYFVNVKKSTNLSDDFSTFITSTFSKAPNNDKHDFDDSDKLIKTKEVLDILNNENINLVEFIEKLKEIGGETNLLDIKDEVKLKKLYDEFFVGSSNFNKLYKKFNKLFTSKNYYLKTLFFHKVGCRVRSTGSPEENVGNLSTQNVFNISKLINRLIKAYKNFEVGNDRCQIVINSLKNSLEIMYFKERYSAFYMMAVHNEKDKSEIFNDIVKDSVYKSETVKKLTQLDQAEYKTQDFKKGLFSSPDIENCIQKSDIHIIYEMPDSAESLQKLPLLFTTLHEQLLKYLSLIQQPGIITPSNIERCMQIAFNSKLNSGCVSRQVGAIVTNEGFSVKAIGWNDTPKKTIPCILRNVEEVINGSSLDCDDHTYSDFELPSSNNRYKVNENHFDKYGRTSNEQYVNKNFSENVKTIYPTDKLDILKKEGKSCSYCFKTLHNYFVGEENQVHTRSLHAEENAMLQISKFGGQGLKNGYLFVTASPCELCSKKSYQLGITKIYYIDRYPGIAKEHIIGVGFDAPKLIQFNGIVGRSFNKLYEPFLSYKDELNIYLNKETLVLADI